MKKEKEYDNEKTASLSRSVSSDFEMKKERQTNWLPAIVMLVGVIMVVYGIFRGEMAVVCSKAIQICLECIGIG